MGQNERKMGRNERKMGRNGGLRDGEKRDTVEAPLREKKRESEGRRRKSGF